jgi:hypothetical protein
MPRDTAPLHERKQLRILDRGAGFFSHLSIESCAPILIAFRATGRQLSVNAILTNDYDLIVLGYANCS